MTGLKGDLIHMFNKNETAVQHEDYFKQLKGKNNVILLGDSLGDVHMATGVVDINVVLKIGFLNDNASAFLTVTFLSILILLDLIFFILSLVSFLVRILL